MTRSNAKMHQYQRTSYSLTANTISFHMFNQHQHECIAIYDCHCSLIADGYEIAIVYGIPSDDTIKFKHTPIPTHTLCVQSQHDSVSYIHNMYWIKVKIRADPHVPFQLFKSRQHQRRVMCYMSEFKHAPIPTYILFIQSQHDTVLYIQPTSTTAQSRMWLPS